MALTAFVIAALNIIGIFFCIFLVAYVGSYYYSFRSFGESDRIKDIWMKYDQFKALFPVAKDRYYISPYGGRYIFYYHPESDQTYCIYFKNILGWIAASKMVKKNSRLAKRRTKEQKAVKDAIDYIECIKSQINQAG